MWVFTHVNITWNQCVLVLRFSWMETILDSAEAALVLVIITWIPISYPLLPASTRAQGVKRFTQSELRQACIRRPTRENSETRSDCRVSSSSWLVTSRAYSSWLVGHYEIRVLKWQIVTGLLTCWKNRFQMFSFRLKNILNSFCHWFFIILFTKGLKTRPKDKDEGQSHVSWTHQSS